MKTLIMQVAALGVVATAALPAVANAQEAAPTAPTAVERGAPVTTETTTSQATGPSMAMVESGLTIFGLSYLPAVVVGAESGLGADRSLFVPIVGPWVDLTQRPGCAAGTSCNSEDTAKVLIVVDGLFQAIGALTILGGFLTTAHETKTVRSAAAQPTLRLRPAQMGQGGYGMLALGSF